MTTGAPNAAPAYRLPEALTLLVINTHGLVALNVYGAQPWQIFCVAAVAGVGLCRLIKPRLIPPLASFAAVLSLTWVLMASTGGVSSFFLAWLFMLALFYPLRLEGFSAALVAPVVGALYLSLLLFPSSLPLALVLSRALLLSIVGASVHLLARQLHGSSQRPVPRQPSVLRNRGVLRRSSRPCRASCTRRSPKASTT